MRGFARVWQVGWWLPWHCLLDGGYPPEGINVFILVWDQCLVFGLPGIECVPQGDGLHVCMLDKNRISVGRMFMIVAAGVVHWSCCVGCDGAGVCVGCNEYWFRCTLEFCGVVEGCVWDMDELGCAAPLEGITNES